MVFDLFRGRSSLSGLKLFVRVRDGTLDFVERVLSRGKDVWSAGRAGCVGAGRGRRERCEGIMGLV